MKRFLCIFIALMCVLGLMCACSQEVPPTVSPSESTEPTPTPTVTPDDGEPSSVAEFKIIYPESDYAQKIFYDKAMLEQSMEFFNRGVSVSAAMDTDVLENGEAESKYEILIGPTNRKESDEVANSMEIRTTDYVIRFVNDKIVILAGSSNSYIEAVRALAQICDDNGLFDCNTKA